MGLLMFIIVGERFLKTSKSVENGDMLVFWSLKTSKSVENGRMLGYRPSETSKSLKNEDMLASRLLPG